MLKYLDPTVGKVQKDSELIFFPPLSLSLKNTQNKSFLFRQPSLDGRRRNDVRRDGAERDDVVRLHDTGLRAPSTLSSNDQGQRRSEAGAHDRNRDQVFPDREFPLLLLLACSVHLGDYCSPKTSHDSINSRQLRGIKNVF